MLTSTFVLTIRILHEVVRTQKLLAAKGCRFENHRGGSGICVRFGSRTSQLPVHGSGKDLGTGLVNKILKDLGLKRD